MKIHFLGAAGDVTGSAYHVRTKQASVLVDCGMFQGGKASKARNRPILSHGEDRARRTLADLIQSKHGIRALCPKLGDVINV